MKVERIGTHDGYPHADETLAVATILAVPDNKGAEVLRTRSAAKLSKCDMRVDVGMKYNPPMDFDHHQPDFDLCREDGRPYASAGLVFKHFWRELIPEEDVRVYDRVDDVLFSYVDAMDSGVETYLKVRPYYVYDLSSALAHFSPHVSKLRNLRKSEQRKLLDDGFMRAVRFTQEILQDEIYRARLWVQDQELTERAIMKAAGKNPQLIILNRSCSWGKAVATKAPEALFVVFKDELAKEWCLQTVPIPGQQFSSKKLLPRSWAGKRGKDLVAVTGVEGAKFCHRARFLAIARTKEAILELAEQALG